MDCPGGGLRLAERLDPEPSDDQVRVRVSACGVCRTDLHILDGEVSAGHLPLVLGHQIVGVREDTGERVGIPWLGWTCGECGFCLRGQENLCDRARFTGCDIDGGFAELTVADPRFCLPIPDGFDDLSAAPLLCGGLIGYRALRFAGDAARLGIYGFGSAAHMICQVAVHEGREVFAFTRPGDDAAQALARGVGAVWAGGSDAAPPEILDGALVFAPDGALVRTALRAVRKGGTVVCGGIHMSDIGPIPYEELWGERVVRSVANLTREDGIEFLEVAARVPVRTHVTRYGLAAAGAALEDLRAGRITGSAVVSIDPSIGAAGRA
jgi:propanol-preferring alcohol dehydrogenase